LKKDVEKDEKSEEEPKSYKFQRAGHLFSSAVKLKESDSDVSIALAFGSIETLKLSKGSSWERIKEFLKNVPEESKEFFLNSQNKYFLESKYFESSFEEIIFALWKEYRCRFLHEGFCHFIPPPNQIQLFGFVVGDKKFRVSQSTIAEDFLFLVGRTMKVLSQKFEIADLNLLKDFDVKAKEFEQYFLEKKSLEKAVEDFVRSLLKGKSKLEIIKFYTLKEWAEKFKPLDLEEMLGKEMTKQFQELIT
jgi:hypothetical protein